METVETIQKQINTEQAILFTASILGLAYIATSLTLLTQL